MRPRGERAHLINQQPWRMKIGVISVSWPPRHGGAEMYAYRLTQALLTRGYEVHVAAGTPAHGQRDQKEILVNRTSEPVPPENEIRCRVWYGQLVPWLAAHRFTHVFINAPLTRPYHEHARELYRLVQDSGSRVGAIHYDVGRDIAAELSWGYGMSGSWETAATRTLEKARAHVVTAGEEKGYRDLESPLFFQPDFVLSCSAWSDRFIDPFARYPHIVLHPLIDPLFWEVGARSEQAAEMEPPLPQVDLSFINPLPHKGVQYLLDLIRHGSSHWKFRVLKGGYGDGLAAFLAAVDKTAAFRAGRVQILDYCTDMRSFYDRTQLFLFPSLYEGYGLAAVEALCRGAPVVARGYPAILEGVGDGALVAPFSAGSDHWRLAIERVLRDRQEWVSKARQRAEELRRRQEQELDALVAFLEAL